MFPSWSVASPRVVVWFEIVVVPSPLSLVVVVDLLFPVPVITVPAGRFEHCSDGSVKVESNFSFSLTRFACALPTSTSANAAIAQMAITGVVERRILPPLS